MLCVSLLSTPSPISLITDDTLCLAWVVQDEARGEPVKGQKAVLDVVLKRMEVRHLSACEVVKQPSQFSGYKQGMEIKLYENVSLESLTKLHELCKMEPVVKNSEYFHAQSTKPSWRNKMKRVVQIGKHIFYRSDTKGENQ